jgi:hypothetical protein
VQHPVGYHPTTACSAQDTNTRGFDAWMSRDDSGDQVPSTKGTTLLDPVRTRNMTQASRVFGVSHLVCDAHAYAAQGHVLNPYYMQSKWDPFAQADPAVPMQAPVVDQPGLVGLLTRIPGQMNKGHWTQSGHTGFQMKATVNKRSPDSSVCSTSTRSRTLVEEFA